MCENSLWSCQSICGNYFYGIILSVIVKHLGDVMPDPISNSFIGEEVVHGPSAATHLRESLPQDIGNPDGLPKLPVKIMVVGAVEEDPSSCKWRRVLLQ